MRPIHIPELRQAPDHTRELLVEEHMPDLNTLTPMKGELRVVHQGTYLDVTANVEGIVTLTCHRCLQQYNHRLDVQAQELIWLEEEPDPVFLSGEREIAFDEFVETLSPQGDFDPRQWLYEQCCLALPRRQLCDRDCDGGESSGSAASPASDLPLVDQRWASLAALKQQLSNN